MSSVPVTCPRCYKTEYTPSPASDGLVRCDACGHAFPVGGGNPAGKFVPPPFPPTPGMQPAYSAPMSAPGGKYAPSYPPASGPQNPGNPGLMACGVIVGLGFLCLLCCGGVGGFLYFLADEQLVAHQNINPPPVNPPPFVPPQFDPPQFNPAVPDLNQPVFNPPLPRPFPDIPPPVLPEPAFPGVADDNPFEPFTPPGDPAKPPAAPATPAPPSPKTLDDFITAMGTIDASRFTARQLLDDFNMLPVEEARRDDVVDALLELLKRAKIQAAGLMAGPGEVTLENWATEAHATKIAEFAAEEENRFARRPLLKVLAKIGGDVETAKALLPLMKDISVRRELTDTFTKIGPEAEEPLLTQLDTADRLPKMALFEVLGKIGGAKSKEKLQALIRDGEGFDKVFGAKALNEIQSREGIRP